MGKPRDFDDSLSVVAARRHTGSSIAGPELGGCRQFTFTLPGRGDPAGRLFGRKHSIYR